jgi:hypothetical protein
MVGNVASCSDKAGHSCPIHEDARGSATVSQSPGGT